jgi:HEAT repeat protein
LSKASGLIDEDKYVLDRVDTLLTHDNIDVRIEVIRIYAELQFVNDIELLKLMYPEENKKVKLEIIDALRILGDEETARFLRRQFAEENDYDINMALSYACHSLLGNVTIFEEADFKEPYDLHLYILHVTDPLI